MSRSDQWYLVFPLSQLITFPVQNVRRGKHSLSFDFLLDHFLVWFSLQVFFQNGSLHLKLSISDFMKLSFFQDSINWIWAFEDNKPDSSVQFPVPLGYQSCFIDLSELLKVLAGFFSSQVFIDAPKEYFSFSFILFSLLTLKLIKACLYHKTGLEHHNASPKNLLMDSGLFELDKCIALAWFRDWFSDDFSHP